MLFDPNWKETTTTTTFLSATDLKIEPQMHSALVKVLAMLESGKIKSLSESAEWRPEQYFGEIKYFDMGHVMSVYDCGTAGCLLGWAKFVNKKSAMFSPKEYHQHKPLHQLFFPTGNGINCRDTVKAAKVLRTYLETGKVIWNQVCPSKR